MRQVGALHLAGQFLAERLDRERLQRADRLGIGVAVFQLHRFGQLEGQVQASRRVVGDMVPAHGDHRRVPHRAIDEHRQVGRAAADIDHHDAGLAFLVGQDHVA